MIKILLIYTFDISLKTWHDQGLLGRELLLYKRMLREGKKIALLTYGDKKDLEFKKYLDGIEVYPIYTYVRRPNNKIIRLFMSFYLPFKLKSIFKDYDIYKTNQMLGAWVAVIAKILYKKKLVVRCGYEWLRNAFREAGILKKISIALFGYPIEFLCYAASDRIIVSSISIFNFIKRAFRPFAHKVVYIPNFVDTEFFKKMDVKETYNNRALYVGRLNRVKNLMGLFKAIKGSEHGLGLDIIGDGKDLNGLKRFISDNKIDVRFLGSMPNDRLPVQINRYPVFILPSFFENNPKALLEAMACERVTVGTDVEGIKELIVDNVNGILVKTDKFAIRRGLEKAFALKEVERAALGKRAKELVTERFAFDKVYNKEKDVYESLTV